MASRRVHSAVFTFFVGMVWVCIGSADPDADTCTPECLKADAVPWFLHIDDCDEGFWCPNTDPDDEDTLPVICPPTPECEEMRWNHQACAAQGWFEPVVCPGGSYCPNPRNRTICPAGHFCVKGSTFPRPCPALSLCPPGTTVFWYYGGMIYAFVVDLVVVLAILAHRSYFEPKSAVQRASMRLLRSRAQHLDVAEGGDLSRAARDVTRAFRDCNAGFRFEITFEGVSVVRHGRWGDSTVETLRNACGRIHAGRVTAVMGPSGAGELVFVLAVTELATSTPPPPPLTPDVRRAVQVKRRCLLR